MPTPPKPAPIADPAFIRGLVNMLRQHAAYRARVEREKAEQAKQEQVNQAA